MLRQSIQGNEYYELVEDKVANEKNNLPRTIYPRKTTTDIYNDLL